MGSFPLCVAVNAKHHPEHSASFKILVYLLGTFKSAFGFHLISYSVKLSCFVKIMSLHVGLQRFEGVDVIQTGDDEHLDKFLNCFPGEKLSSPLGVTQKQLTAALGYCCHVL